MVQKPERFRKYLSWRLLAMFSLVAVGILLLPVPPAFVEHSDDAGYALSFDGNNDFVRLHETNQMMHATWQETKTVSLWVKPQGTTICRNDPAQCKIIFGDRSRWWGITIGELNGQDKIWVWNFDGNYDYVSVDYTLDTWVHVTLVHENGTLTAYRNGFEVGSTISGATEQPNSGALPVLHLGGIIVDSNTWTFTGELDEVRLWNYARTTVEVQQDLLHPLLGDELGLLAYYRMSDGTGLALTDDSGNGWNGTLHDGTTAVPPDGSPPQWVTSNAFDTPIATPTPTATSTATPTSTSAATQTPTSTATPATSATPTSTATAMPNSTASVTPTPTNGPPSTATATPTPTGTLPTPTPSPTLDPDSGSLRIYVPLVTNGQSTP